MLRLAAAAALVIPASLAAAQLIGGRLIRVALAVGRVTVRDSIEQRNAGVLIRDAGAGLRICAGLRRNIGRDRRNAPGRRAVRRIAEDGMFVLAELHQAGIVAAFVFVLRANIIARLAVERCGFALQRRQVVEILRVFSVRVPVLSVVVVVVSHYKNACRPQTPYPAPAACSMLPRPPGQLSI
jgi:hypothetical protein